MSHGDLAPSVTLGHYWDVLARRWWVALLGAVVGLCLAVVYLALAPQTASATASLSLNVISTDPFNVNRSATGLIDSASEAQVASSYAVTARAAERLGGGASPQSVKASVRVVGLPDTTILQVTASADSAAEAQLVADVLAEEFLEHRSAQAQARIARSLEQSAERVSELQEELREVDQRIADAEPGSGREVQAQSDRSLLTLQISSALSEAASTQNIDTSAGSILNPADRNPVKWTPRRGLVLVSGAVAGFGLGVISAFLLGTLRSRIRSVRDVRQHGGGAVLGSLSQGQITLPPTDQDMQELRAIRERLLADGHLAQAGVLTVIDDTDGSSAGVVPASLAFVMALSGLRVEYIAASATGPDLAELVSDLELRPRREGSTNGTRYRSAEAPTFTLFVPHRTVGAEEPFGNRIREELATRRLDGLVILALGREAGEASRLAACRLADAVLLVLSRGSTRAQYLQQVSRDARVMGAHVLGSLLVPRHRAIPAESDCESVPEEPTAGSDLAVRHD